MKIIGGITLKQQKVPGEEGDYFIESGPQQVWKRVRGKWNFMGRQVIPDQVMSIDRGIIVRSEPPEGACRILNMYWDPSTQKVNIQLEDEPL